MTQWEENNKEIDKIKILKKTKNYTVYAIRLLDKSIKNRKIYVGMSKNPQDRWIGEIRSAFNNNDLCYNLPLSRFFRKYAKNKSNVKEVFEFAIIDEFDNFEDVKNAEIKYIAKFKTNIYRFGNLYGYNLTDGGDGASGYKHTPDTIKLMSKSQSGDKGSGAKLTWDIVKKIRDGFYLFNYKIKYLAEKYNISHSNVSGILQNKKWIEDNFEYDINQYITRSIKAKANNGAKLTFNIINQIREEFYVHNFNIEYIIEKYDISNSHIRKIIKNEIWIDDNFKYAINKYNIIAKEAKINKNNTKLTWNTVNQIREEFYVYNFTAKQLAEKHNITSGNIRLIVQNKSWIEENFKYNINEYKKNIKSNNINNNAKLTWNIINQIRSEYKLKTYSVNELSEKYNISASMINKIIYNQSWKDPTYVK